jgi:hypothetical protein
VVGPPPRTTTQDERIFPATLGAGASFPDFAVACRQETTGISTPSIRRSSLVELRKTDPSAVHPIYRYNPGIRRSTHDIRSDRQTGETGAY